MKKVYFETRLSKTRIEVRLCNSSYIRLTTHKKYNPFTLYVHDDWAYSWKEQPEIFTPYQLKRLKSFEIGRDFIDHIEVDGIIYDYFD